MHTMVTIVSNFYRALSMDVFLKRQTLIRTSRSGAKGNRDAGEKYSLGKGEKLAVAAAVNQMNQLV